MPGQEPVTVIIAMATVALGAWLLYQARAIGRFTAGLPFARLFSRKTGKEVLEHPVRAKIHDAIRANPGITVPALCPLVGIKESTLRYHLRVLVREEQVQVRAHGRKYHLRATSAQADAAVAARECLFWRRRADLAKAILARPGSNQSAVCVRTGLPASRVSTYVRDLVQAGLVDSRRQGRYKVYYPTGLLEGVLADSTTE